MPDIVSPSPRRACSSNTLQLPEMLSQNQQPIQSPHYHLVCTIDVSDHSILYPLQPSLSARTFVAPPRLLSPITLREAPYITVVRVAPDSRSIISYQSLTEVTNALQRLIEEKGHPARLPCGKAPSPPASYRLPLGFFQTDSHLRSASMDRDFGRAQEPRVGCCGPLPDTPKGRLLLIYSCIWACPS